MILASSMTYKIVKQESEQIMVSTQESKDVMLNKLARWDHQNNLVQEPKNGKTAINNLNSKGASFLLSVILNLPFSFDVLFEPFAIVDDILIDPIPSSSSHPPKLVARHPH